MLTPDNASNGVFSATRGLRPLPTLHKNIARAFARVVLVFGGLGTLLVLGIFFAGRMPSLLVRMNYDSIAYVRQMEEAMHGLRFPHLYSERSSPEWRERFRDALSKERGNITEHDERVVVDTLAGAWATFDAALDKGHPDAAFSVLRKELNALVLVNERGMFRRLDENSLIRDILVLAGALLFLAGTVWAFFQADAIAARIAHPLRRAAEVFKDYPSLRRSLRLPDPQALEVRILFDELARLWERLGVLEALNVDTLLAEKNKLEVILDSAEDAVLVLGASGMVAHVSEKLLEILNLPRGEVEGKIWSDLASSSSQYLTLREALRQDLQGVRDIELVEPGSSESSGTLSAESCVYAARRRELPDGRGQVFLLSNVTEKRRRTVLRSAMMDWISHELKTPVQSLGLASDLLARRDDLDGDLQMLVDTVRQDAARLRTVAGQFMEIARMSPQALQLRPEPVDLAACVTEWLGPFQLAAREAGVQLVLDAVANLPLVRLDRERFAWVLSNLVSNALRVSHSGGHVLVSVQVEPPPAVMSRPRLVLRVEDDGPGISSALEATMFEPFSHGRTAGSKEGLVGLGLAIVRSIVDAHGGFIRYARRDGGGSVFTVMI